MRNRFINFTFGASSEEKKFQKNQKQDNPTPARSYYFDLQIIIIGDFFDRIERASENI